MKKLNALFVVIILLLSSCRSDDGTMLSVAVAQEPPTLDVMVNSSVSGRNIVVGNVYERFLVLDENGDILPWLASGYELSEDGHTFWLSIRENVFFHDGTKLELSDAIASLNRWIGVYGNAGKLTAGAFFTEEDGRLVMRSSASLALLPLMLSSSPQAAVAFQKEAIDNETDNGLVASSPGTGPYKIMEWIPGAYIDLSLNGDYWGEKPVIEDIRYNFVQDPVTRRMGLESGQYDFIDTVLSDDIPALSENDSITLHQGGETGSIVLVMNKREGIGMDNDFRKAVSLLIDREELMRSCYGDYGYSLHSDYMEEGEGWSVDPSLDPYGRHDSEKAMAMLASSKYNGEKIRILSSNLSNLDKIAITLSFQLEEAGIDTEIIILDWASFSAARYDSSSWDIYVSATSRVVLPIEKGYLFSTSAGGFDDVESENLIEQVSASPTLDEAKDRWMAAQLRLWEYIPVIVPGHYSTVYASSSALQEIGFSDGYDFRKASFE